MAGEDYQIFGLAGELDRVRARHRHLTRGRRRLAAGADHLSSPGRRGVHDVGSRLGSSDVVYDLGMRLCDLAHQAAVEPVHRVADIPRLRGSGRQGLVFAVESCTPIENELDRLDILLGLGVRSMGLVYSEANCLGSGANLSICM